MTVVGKDSAAILNSSCESFNSLDHKPPAKFPNFTTYSLFLPFVFVYHDCPRPQAAHFNLKSQGLLIYPFANTLAYRKIGKWAVAMYQIICFQLIAQT